MRSGFYERQNRWEVAGRLAREMRRISGLLRSGWSKDGKIASWACWFALTAHTLVLGILRRWACICKAQIKLISFAIHTFCVTGLVSRYFCGIIQFPRSVFLIRDHARGAGSRQIFPAQVLLAKFKLLIIQFLYFAADVDYETQTTLWWSWNQMTLSLIKLDVLATLNKVQIMPFEIFYKTCYIWLSTANLIGKLSGWRYINRRVEDVERSDITFRRATVSVGLYIRHACFAFLCDSWCLEEILNRK